MSVEDRAQEQELRVWARINAVRNTKQYAAGEAGYGPAACTRCDNPMPELRRIDGRSHCTDCQAMIERRQRRL